MFKIKQTASLSEHYFLNTSKLRSIRWLIIVFLSVLSFSISIAFKVLFFQMFILFIGLMITVYIGRKIKECVYHVEGLLIVRENLLFMISRNSFLFTAKDGAIVSSAKFNYQLNDVSIVVQALKSGDEFSTEMDNLDVLLSSALGISLSSKEIYATYVEYVFVYRPPERQHITFLPLEDDTLEIQIYGDLIINLRDNFSMLVSGASGAGKSYFTYFWLTRFISKTVNGKRAKLFVVDPKQAELYKLCKVSGMSTNYGATKADAFRIVRLFLEEMEHRMNIYNNSSAFNSVGVDIGLPVALLVIEEYSSLVASLNSREKTDFENMVSIIAQKSRSLSMGVCIVMQQPRADSLSTNIREQLVNAIFLGGSPSRETSQMMFATTDVPKVQKGKGVGLYSIEREPPKEFQAPIFDRDVFETILPVWECAAKDYKKDEECVK
ncbi:TPA: cell division protein FtsK [Streptococcus pneumoniae]|nr:cell division protein FtsK [Streptococcus pneumoniae]HEW2782679.1 cell division protein FtsK [Streptococcus pneumoniae]